MRDAFLPARNKRNLIFFILSYVINNLVSGVLYDTYVNYLQEVSLGIATSFWSFYGYATFISAILLMVVPRIGYKKLLIFCALACSLAMLSVVFTDAAYLYYVATLLSLVGVQLHYIMLAPYVAAYTEGSDANDSIQWYTRTYYMGYVGYFIATYLGGAFVVKIFQLKLGETYAVAQQYTTDLENLADGIKVFYLQANQEVLLIFGVLSLLSLIPLALIQERKEDYQNVEAIQESASIIISRKDLKSLLTNKQALVYLAYWSLVSFAMGLFTSYFTVFLNRNLHVDKATASLLVSISYIAIVLFMFATPFFVRKLGRVVTICFTLLMSIPFMLIIANGDAFGDAMIPVLGVALFMRSGLANLGSPAESSLSMSLVLKELRPAFTTCINLLAGSVSVLSGMFTGNVLFVNQEGYKTAYYIAAVLYFLCCVIVYCGFRVYNRSEGT